MTLSFFFSNSGIVVLSCHEQHTSNARCLHPGSLAIEAFRNAGLAVPEDVSVVGFDGTEVSAYAHPALTTVEVPLHEIGKRGVEELLCSLRDDVSTETEGKSQILMPTGICVRSSTAARGK